MNRIACSWWRRISEQFRHAVALWANGSGWLRESGHQPLAVLARRMTAYELPLPLAIFPDSGAEWTIKVAGFAELLAWARALGFSTAGLRPWGSSVRFRWVVSGRVAGVRLVVWCPADPPPEITPVYDGQADL